METQHCWNPRFPSYPRDLADSNRESVRSTFLLFGEERRNDSQLAGFSSGSNDEIRRRKDILGIPLFLVYESVVVRLD